MASGSNTPEEKKNKVRELTIRLAKVETQAKDSESEKMVLQRKLETSYKEREELEKNINLLKGRLGGEASKGQSPLDGRSVDLDSALEKQMKLNEQLSAELDMLRKRNSELQDKIAELASAETSEGDGTENPAVAVLKEELEQFRQAKSESDRRVIDSMAELKKFKNSSEKSEAELAQLKAAIGGGGDIPEDMLEKLKQKGNEIIELRELFEKSQADMKKISAAYETIYNEKKQLEEFAERLQGESADSSELATELAKTQDELEEALAKLASVEEAASLASAAYQDVSREKQAMTTVFYDKEKLEKKVAELELSLKDVEIYKSENEAKAELAGEAESAKNDEIAVAKEQITVLKEKLEVSYRLRDELEKEFEAFKQKSESADNIAGQVEASELAKKLKEENTHLSARVADLTDQLNKSSDEEPDDLEAKFVSAVQERNEARAEIERLQKEAELFDDKLESAHKRMAELIDEVNLKRESPLAEDVRAKKESHEIFPAGSGDLGEALEHAKVELAEKNKELAALNEQVEALAHRIGILMTENQGLEKELETAKDNAFAVVVPESNRAEYIDEIEDRDRVIAELSEEIAYFRDEKERLTKAFAEQKIAYNNLERKFVDGYLTAKPGETKPADIVPTGEKDFSLVQQEDKMPLPPGVEILSPIMLGDRPFAYLFDSAMRDKCGSLDDVVEIVNSYSVGISTTRFAALQKYYGEPLRSHSHNVARMSIAAGIEMGLDKKAVQLLGICSLVHDVGLQLITGITPEMLLKSPESLTVMLRHPKLSADVLDCLENANTLMKRIVYEHHERINGAGYPRRLRGRDIHMLSQVIGIADTIEGLVSGRIGEKKSIEKTLDFLEEGANAGKFNIGLVRNFRAPLLFRKKNKYLDKKKLGTTIE